MTQTSPLTAFTLRRLIFLALFILLISGFIAGLSAGFQKIRIRDDCRDRGGIPVGKQCAQPFTPAVQP